MGTILVDVSKAYDCLPHNILVTKLEAYGQCNIYVRFPKMKKTENENRYFL